MIAANYTMDLYCDCSECLEKNSWRKWNHNTGEFVGTSWTDVVRQARKCGWRISKDRTRCFAPGHKINRKIIDE